MAGPPDPRAQRRLVLKAKGDNEGPVCYLWFVIYFYFQIGNPWKSINQQNKVRKQNMFYDHCWGVSGGFTSSSVLILPSKHKRKIAAMLHISTFPPSLSVFILSVADLISWFKPVVSDDYKIIAVQFACVRRSDMKQ